MARPSDGWVRRRTGRATSLGVVRSGGCRGPTSQVARSIRLPERQPWKGALGSQFRLIKSPFMLQDEHNCQNCHYNARESSRAGSCIEVKIVNQSSLKRAQVRRGSSAQSVAKRNDRAMPNWVIPTAIRYHFSLPLNAERLISRTPNPNATCYALSFPTPISRSSSISNHSAPLSSSPSPFPACFSATTPFLLLKCQSPSAHAALPKSIPGCIIVRVSEAIMPSRIMHETSAFAKWLPNPPESSVTRKTRRAKIVIVASASAVFFSESQGKGGRVTYSRGRS